MTTPLVVTRREDALFYVGLNRPEKRNAIHRELLLALVDAVAAAERDRDVRAVIVYGEGPVFSAGVIGLVNQVVPPGDHLAAAARLANEIAANAPLAVGLAKRLIDLGHGVDKQTFLQMELLAQSILVRTDDVREGARAAMERRPP